MYKHFSVLQERRGNVLTCSSRLTRRLYIYIFLPFIALLLLLRTSGMSYMYKHFSVLQERRGNVLTCSSRLTRRLYIYIYIPSFYRSSSSSTLFSQFVLSWEVLLLLVLLFAFWLVRFGGNGGEVRVAVTGKDLITHPPLLLAQWVSTPNFSTPHKKRLCHTGDKGVRSTCSAAHAHIRLDMFICIIHTAGEPAAVLGVVYCF